MPQFSINIFAKATQSNRWLNRAKYRIRHADGLSGQCMRPSAQGKFYPSGFLSNAHGNNDQPRCCPHLNQEFRKQWVFWIWLSTNSCVSAAFRTAVRSRLFFRFSRWGRPSRGACSQCLWTTRIKFGASDLLVLSIVMEKLYSGNSQLDRVIFTPFRSIYSEATNYPRIFDQELSLFSLKTLSWSKISW